MASARNKSSTYRSLEVLLKAVPNKQAYLIQPIEISDSLSVNEMLNVLNGFSEGQAVKVSKNITLEKAEAFKLLETDVQLIVDAETPENILIAISQNMPPFCRLVLPGTLPLEAGKKVVTHLAPSTELLLTYDMPEHTLLSLLKLLPRGCFLAVDCRMDEKQIKTLIEHLPSPHGINLDFHLPVALATVIRKTKKEGCWINELMGSTPSMPGTSIPLTTLQEIPEIIKQLNAHKESYKSPDTNSTNNFKPKF